MFSADFHTIAAKGEESPTDAEIFRARLRFLRKHTGRACQIPRQGAASPFLERDKFSVELILCKRLLQDFAISPFFLDPCSVACREQEWDVPGLQHLGQTIADSPARLTSKRATSNPPASIKLVACGTLVALATTSWPSSSAMSSIIMAIKLSSSTTSSRSGMSISKGASQAR